MKEIVELFDSRLNTLSLLIDQATQHFGGSSFLGLRLADDMFPLGTQIAFTCNQPHNFAQWLCGQEVTNLDAELESVDTAKKLIAETRKAITSLDLENVSAPERKRLDLGPSRYADLSADEYVDDFLIPNFYFHLVTTYDILRANGVKIGKANYMAHLLDRVRERVDV